MVAFATDFPDFERIVRGLVVEHRARLFPQDGESVEIVDVALASGFNSISRFNEAFRRSCGCSPRDYRRAHLAEVQS